MRSLTIFFIVVLLLSGKGLFSQNDSISFRILTAGNTHIKNADPLLITSDQEYFDYYYNIYGVFPKDFRWDFDKESILVVYKTLSSGSHGIIINAVLESYKYITVITSESKSNFYTCDIGYKFIMLAIKKTNKPVIAY